MNGKPSQTICFSLPVASRLVGRVPQATHCIPWRKVPKTVNREANSTNKHIDIRTNVLLRNGMSNRRRSNPRACRNIHAKKNAWPTELALFTHFAVAVPMSNHIIWQGIGMHKRARVHDKNSLNQHTQQKAPSSWKATGANAKSHGNDNWA